MPQPNGSSAEHAPSIEIANLSYAFPDGSSGLQNVQLSLPPASRTLLIGGMFLPFRTLARFATHFVPQIVN